MRKQSRLRRTPSGGGRVDQFIFYVVAQVSYGVAIGVLDLADEIDENVLCSAFLGECKFTAGNLDHDGQEVLGAVKLEVVYLYRKGKLRDGIVQHERVLKLALAIHVGEMRELLVGEVTLAIFKLCVDAIDADLNVAKFAVGGSLASTNTIRELVPNQERSNKSS